MWKTLAATIAVGCTLTTPLATLANSYDKFIKTQAAEFKNNRPVNCKEKTLTAESENGAQLTYELCVVNNSPVSLRTSNDGAPVLFSSFKKGKLVQINWVEAASVGFRNEKPVVEWNIGERKVNWKLNAAEQAQYSEAAAEEKKILRKFGF
jgi:hypothetical protein